MVKKLEISEKLDFSDIDLTAPDKVIENILLQLSCETNNIISGEIKAYNGKVFSYSYVKKGFASLAEELQDATKTFNVQDDLGEMGQEAHKFECYIYTPEYDKYKYRVFFIKYGISNYPVDVILEESVAKSISSSKTGYIYTCDTREELENLIFNIFNSKKLITIMQKIIRINQAKRIHKETDKNSISNETDEI